MEELETKVFPCKKLAEPAAKFFAFVAKDNAHMTHMASMGKGFHESIKEMETYLKISIAVQSGVAVLKKNDPQKAASFEDKLRPRNVTLSDLPKSLANQITGLAKRA